MRLVCISDTHGDHEEVELPAGDVLIHAGDVTGHGTESETRSFFNWMAKQSFDHKICIAGNHDTFMEDEPVATQHLASEANVSLLNASGVQIDGINFWGSPITPRFMHWSFMLDEGAPIEAHWQQMPANTDVLITHGPPYGVLDVVIRDGMPDEAVGCHALLNRISEVKPKLHLFGHIHEGFGSKQVDSVLHRNISTMNRHYQIANEPQVIELS